MAPQTYGLPTLPQAVLIAVRAAALNTPLMVGQAAVLTVVLGIDASSCLISASICFFLAASSFCCLVWVTISASSFCFSPSYLARTASTPSTSLRSCAASRSRMVSCSVSVSGLALTSSAPMSCDGPEM